MENEPSEIAKKAKNGKFQFTPEIEAKILDACGAGFTIEKAGALVGVNPSTIRTWCQRKPKFAEKVETARKTHELSLVKSIEQAGEKSWQAKAWILERGYNWAQPSARLQVSGSVEHGVNDSFSKLLAGLASRRAEKKAQVIDAQEIKALPEPQSKYNSYCATDELQTIGVTMPEKIENLPGKNRHVRMRRRKPRSRPAHHDTPTGQPPPPISHDNTP